MAEVNYPADAGKADPWQIRLFRSLEIRWGEKVLAVKECKAGYVLATLAFHTDGPYAREELARTYWPDAATPGMARDSLRAALAYLNRHLLSPHVGPSVLIGSRSFPLALAEASCRW